MCCEAMFAMWPHWTTLANVSRAKRQPQKSGLTVWIKAFNFCIPIHSQLQHLYGCLLSPRATFPGPPYLKLVPSLRQQPLTDDKLDTQPGIWKINLYLNCQWVRKCTWLGERCTRWGPFPKVFIWPTPQEIQKWRGRVGLKTQCLYEEWLSTMAISKDAQDGDLFKKFSLDPRLKSKHPIIGFKLKIA